MTKNERAEMFINVIDQIVEYWFSDERDVEDDRDRLESSVFELLSNMDGEGQRLCCCTLLNKGEVISCVYLHEKWYPYLSECKENKDANEYGNDIKKLKSKLSHIRSGIWELCDGQDEAQTEYDKDFDEIEKIINKYHKEV